MSDIIGRGYQFGAIPGAIRDKGHDGSVPQEVNTPLGTPPDCHDLRSPGRSCFEWLRGRDMKLERRTHGSGGEICVIRDKSSDPSRELARQSESNRERPPWPQGWGGSVLGALRRWASEY